jgi:ketosteroid isomerase-like protein
VSVVGRFAAAFDAGDVEALLACFTEHASYLDGFYGPHAGHPALREMFARMVREGHDYRWTMDTVVETADADREYFDTGAALLQLGFADGAMARVLRRKHGMA